MIKKVVFRISPVLCASVLIAFLAGCTTTIASFGTLSIEPVDRNSKYTLVERNAQGQDFVYLIWCIPLGIPSIEKAARDILNKYDGDFIDNVSVQQVFFWTYFFGRYGYKITGNVYREMHDTDTTVNTADFRLFRSGKKDVLIEASHD